MFAVQNISLIFGLIGLTLLIFICSGFLTASFISKGRLNSLEELILAFVFGALSLSMLAVSSLLFGLNGESQSAIILLYIILGLPRYLTSLINVIKDNIVVLTIWFLYSAFAIFTVLNPSLELKFFTLADVQNHFALPIDNLIPFQTVRYITERIDPNLLDPVPNWQFGNRGPFLGFSISSIFLLLGIHETSPWLNSSYPSALLFEIASIVFNSLCFIVAYSFSTRFFGKKIGFFTLVMLVMNPFCYINIVFSWPKLFAAALGLFALQLILIPKPLFLISSVVLALGYLAHESLVFSILPFLIFVFFRFGLIRFIFSVVTFIATLAPWTFYKIYWNQNTNNIFIHNVLCYKDNIEGSFYELFKERLNTEGLASFIKVRLDNFYYPFDFSFIDWIEKFSSLSGILSIPQTLTDITFYQFIYAVGPVFFLTFLASCVYKVKYRPFESDLNIVFVALITSAFAVGVFQGCVLSSWNHHWAYLPLLVITIYTTKEVVKVNPIVSFPIMFLQGTLNLTILYNYIWYPPRSSVRLLINSPREIGIVSIAVLLVVIIIAQLFTNSRKKLNS